MKVLLVKPTSETHVILPPLGLGYLASYLQRELTSIDLTILDCNRERISQEQFKRIVQKGHFDIIGFTALSMEIRSAITLASAAKDVLKNVTVVFGGPHASGAPQHLLLHDCVDYVFRGEAEIGFAFFLNHFYSEDRLKASGLGYRSEGSIILNDPEFVINLDTLPFPDYKKMQFEKYPKMYFMKNAPAAPIISSRGCPFCCTFCAGHQVSGRHWRCRSIGNIIEEITYLKQAYGVKEIDFWDDNFTLDRNRTEHFCDALKRSGKKIKWWCPNGIHLNTVDKNLILRMKESGCYAVAFGVESGSDKIRRDMHKHISIAKLKEIVAYAHRIGLRTQGFFIIGYPTETEEDIVKTIQLAKTLPFVRASFCLFQPIVGSSIYQEMIADKRLDEEQVKNMTCDYSKVSTRTEFIQDMLKIKKLQKRAILEFYLRPKILMRLLFENMSFSQLQELFLIVKKYISSM